MRLVSSPISHECAGSTLQNEAVKIGQLAPFVARPHENAEEWIGTSTPYGLQPLSTQSENREESWSQRLYNLGTGTYQIVVKEAQRQWNSPKIRPNGNLSPTELVALESLEAKRHAPIKATMERSQMLPVLW